jgi:NADH-quinone oxidoreductase subunit C
LKKDYPLTGFVECFYCYEKKRIIIKPLCLLQENRKFSFKPYYLG